MYRNQYRPPPTRSEPTGRQFEFFCERCDHAFGARHITLECPPCHYATHPTRVILGATQGVPA